MRPLLALAVLGALAGCAAGTASDPLSPPAEFVAETKSTEPLREVPPPARPLDIAVYEFPDLTGQHKPNESFADFSRAVTQGADAILVDVLTTAGGGAWFNVVERRGLSNLLRERQIIQATRDQFAGGRAEPLTPLTFAGVLIEGGVVAYETNVLTGGLGARYLGIGGNSEYQKDVVTVNLRLVSVKTGRVALSVTTTKEIYSTLLQTSVFRFVSVDSLFELEAGITRNAPPQLAVREAIELAVFALILEGVESGLFSFADTDAGQTVLERYRERRI